MNFYIVVEGKTEKRLFRKWINYYFPKMKYVDFVSQIKNNNYYIISGKGYPQYFNIIKNAISDVNTLGNIDKLIITVDAELMSEEEKYIEINQYLSKFTCFSPIFIIIENFCIETWLLGNRNLLNSINISTDSTLSNYIKVFNVSTKDPELLPNQLHLSRVSFAYKYLQKLVSINNPNQSYSKRNCVCVSNKEYFNELINRVNDTKHINSFKNFLSIIK